MADFEVCHEMGLSWQEWQDTSLYVRRVWWDCIQARRAAEAAANDATASHQQYGQGVTRIRR